MKLLIGNFGIVTRLQINVFHDDDYKLSKGLFYYLPFKKDTLRDFLELVEEFNDDVEMSADYNYTLMAISEGQIHKYELDSQMNLKYPELFGPDGLLKLFGQGVLPSAIIGKFRQSSLCFDLASITMILISVDYSHVCIYRSGRDKSRQCK